MLWLQVHITGVPIGFFKVARMSLRKVNVKDVLNARVLGHRANVSVPIERMEEHSLARGNVTRVMTALVEARREGMEDSFEDLCVIDLSGKDVLEEIRSRRRS